MMLRRTSEHGLIELQCCQLAVISDDCFLVVAVRTIVVNTPDIVATKCFSHCTIKIISAEIIKVFLLDELCQWFIIVSIMKIVYKFYTNFISLERQSGSSHQSSSCHIISFSRSISPNLSFVIGKANSS